MTQDFSSHYRTVISVALLLCMVGIFIAAGWLGVDYGEHPDEWYLFKRLDHSIETLTFMPQGYYYSGMYFGVGYLALMPELIGTGRSFLAEFRDTRPARPFRVEHYPSLGDMQQKLHAVVSSHAFKLRVRTIFIVLASLAIPLTFLLGRALGRSHPEALLGAGIVALSWEVHSHSRHVAIDNLLMVFGILVLLCIAMAFRKQEWREQAAWLKRAGVAVGCATGCKMGGLLFVVPVLMAGVWVAAGEDMASGDRSGWGLRIRRASSLGIQVAGIAVLVFCITTPGAVLDPVRALTDWARGNWEYNVAAPGCPHFATFSDHVIRTPLYFLTSVSSRFAFVSVVFFLCSSYGFYLMIKERPMLCMVLIAFPCFYCPALWSARLFIVRNLLVLIPVFGLFAARGFVSFFTNWQNIRVVRAACAGFIALWIVLNVAWMFWTASTIEPTASRRAIRDAVCLESCPTVCAFRVESACGMEVSGCRACAGPTGPVSMQSLP